MLSFAQSFIDRLNNASSRHVFRMSVAFPGYDVIIINNGAAATGSTLTINVSGSGSTVLSEGTEYNATSNNGTLAAEIADWINANMQYARATWELVDGTGATGDARLIVFATRTLPSLTITASGSWSTAVTSPTSGWSYEAVMADEPVDGYPCHIEQINGLNNTLNPIERSSSFTEIEITMAADPVWKWAVSLWGIRNSACTVYLGVWSGSDAGSFNTIAWQPVFPLWTRDSRLTSNASGVVINAVSIDGYMREKIIHIPTFMGRHPLQAMQECLDAGGFAKGADSRIDWTSLAPTTDTTRGHFNLSYFRDTANAININTEDEEERKITLWGALEELVALTGGTLRINATGQLEHVPYDAAASALEVWDVDPDTGYDGFTPEVTETEAFLTNRVEWDFAQAQGEGTPGVAQEGRGATFALEDENSKDIYAETFTASFSSRWLNGVSYGAYPYGATGSYYDGTRGIEPTNGYRISYSGSSTEKGKEVVSTFWHDLSGNIGGWYGMRLLSTDYVQYGTPFDPAGETDVTFMVWVRTQGLGDIQYCGQWDGAGAGWKFAQVGKRAALYFHDGVSASFVYTTAEHLYAQNSLGFDGPAWVQVMITFSSGTVTIYINGTSVATSSSGSIPSSFPASALPFRVGPGYSVGAEYSAISNLAYWDSVLGVSERASTRRGLGYPLLTYSGLTTVTEPTWWAKYYTRLSYIPEVGTYGTITTSGNPIPFGPEYGVDTTLCLHTAALTGFSGTRTQMSIPGGGVTSNPTAITGEDAVSGLSDVSGRVAYLMFQPHDAVIHRTGALAADGGLASQDSEYYEHQTSSALENSDVVTFESSPEVVKVNSYFMLTGYPTTPSGGGSVSYTATGNATSKPGGRDAHDPSRNYRMPLNIWCDVDTSYNSEGFTGGRAGFGTVPPRLNSSTAVNEDINFQCGGWYLAGINGWTHTRIVDVTIPAYRSKEILARFRTGVWRLSLRTPLNKIMYQIGDVISLTWGAFFSYGRIGLDSTVTFEIIGKSVTFSSSESYIQWDLALLADAGARAFPTVNPTFPTFPSGPGAPGGLEVVTDNSLVNVAVDFDLDTVEDEYVTI